MNLKLLQKKGHSARTSKWWRLVLDLEELIKQNTCTWTHLTRKFGCSFTCMHTHTHWDSYHYLLATKLQQSKSGIPGKLFRVSFYSSSKGTFFQTHTNTYSQNFFLVIFKIQMFFGSRTCLWSINRLTWTQLLIIRWKTTAHSNQKPITSPKTNNLKKKNPNILNTIHGQINNEIQYLFWSKTRRTTWNQGSVQI